VKLECVKPGGGGGAVGARERERERERAGSGWLGGCCGVTLYFDTRGQRSSSPGGGEKVTNRGRFIQQSFSFGDFQKRFWPLRHLCSCA